MLSDAEKRAMLFIELPAEILFKILSYMSFKEISHLRMVSFEHTFVLIKFILYVKSMRHSVNTINDPLPFRNFFFKTRFFF